MPRTDERRQELGTPDAANPETGSDSTPRADVRKADFLVSLDIDAEWVTHLARHRRCEPGSILRELMGILESRLVDSVRHVDGVGTPVSIQSHLDGRRFEWAS